MFRVLILCALFAARAAFLNDGSLVFQGEARDFSGVPSQSSGGSSDSSPSSSDILALALLVGNPLIRESGLVHRRSPYVHSRHRDIVLQASDRDSSVGLGRRSVVLPVLAAGFASGINTMEPAKAAAPVEFLTYYDKQATCSIKYPKGWERDFSMPKPRAMNYVVGFFDPMDKTNETYVAISVMAISKEVGALKAFGGGLLGYRLKFISSQGDIGNPVTVYEQKETKTTYAFDYSRDGQRIRNNLRIVVRDGIVATNWFVTITVHAPIEKEPELRPMFTEILDSFETKMKVLNADSNPVF